MAAITSLFVAAALACGMTAVGCSSSSSSTPAEAGTDGGMGPMPEAGPGEAGEAGPVEGQCKPPTFMPMSGTVTAGTMVTLASAGLPANGFIYYTTDGTLPTHGSKAIPSGGMISITATEQVYAIAYAMGTGGCTDSAPAMATFTVAVPEAGVPEAATVLPQCGAPTIVPNGGAVPVGSTVSITPPTGFPMNFPAGNAFVYYTTDMTTPTHASSAYSSPIQINATESIRAIAFYPGVCTDSTIALANFTVTQPEGGTLAAPAFNPPAKTGNDDFLVSLTEASYPSATICFTLGAGMTAPTPTCTVSATGATCTGSSQTFNAGAGLGAVGSATINGGVTDPATGNVTVSAIACAPGNMTTAPISQTYKLQVANPTMQGPAPSDTALPWMTPTAVGLAPYNPTLASATNGANLRWNSYTAGTPPALDCTTGTLLVNSTALQTAINPGPLPVQQNITYQGVGCKPGYAPSAVQSFGYKVALTAPAFYDDTTNTVAEGTGTYDRSLAVDVLGCGGATLCSGPNGNTAYTTGAWWGCYGTGTTMPTCGATANTCGTGTLAGTGGNAVQITATATVVNAIACAMNLNPSAAATATYTLQLDPPGLDTTYMAAQAGPGCLNPTATPPHGACTAAGATTPILSYSVPASQVGSLTPYIEESIGTPPPSGGAQPEYQFACTMLNGTPSCAPAGCATGTIVAGTTFETERSVSLGSVVNPGDSWSIIGCPGTAAASVGFAPSAVTTVVFGAPGAAVAPSISPASGTYNNIITPVITNQGTVGEHICYTLDGTMPTCTAGACVAPATTLTNDLGIGGTTVASVAVTSGGSGYTSAPTVTIAAPTGTGGQQAAATATLGFAVASITLPATAVSGCGPNPTVTLTGGAGSSATASATVDSTGTITAMNVVTGGSGFLAGTPPTVNITAGCAGGFISGAAAGTAVLATTGSVISVAVTGAPGGLGYQTVPAVSFTGGGGSGAVAKATLTAALGTVPFSTLNVPTIQEDGTVVTLIGCANGAGSSPPVSATYHFTVATPSVIDVTQSTATTTVGVANGGTLPIGDVIKFGFLSNFSTSTLNVCYTADGTTPTCGTTPTTCGGTALTAGVLVSGTGSFLGGWQSPAITTTPTTFATGINTLKAIACDAAGDQVSSGAYSANLNLTAQTPVATLHGTSTLAATGTYFSAPSIDLASTTGATICYTTLAGGTPACSGGSCMGGSSQFTAGTPISILTTGSVLKAVACSATLTSAVSAGSTYTLNVAPIVLTADPVNVNTTPSDPADPDPCPAAATTASLKIGFDCATFAGTKACSTATTAGLGPTAAAGVSTTHAFICYSTDGTAVTACAAAGTVGSITCFDTGAAGTTAATIVLNSSATIHALACQAGTGLAVNNSAATLPVVFTPYTDAADMAITVDGALTDWTNADERVADNAGAGHGYVTYSGATGTLYFAVNAGYASGGVAGTYLGIYIGNGVTSTAATAGLTALGAPAISNTAGLQYAFQWLTTGAAAPAAFAYDTGTGVWDAAPGITVTAGVPNPVTNIVEFSVPLSSLPNLGGATNPVTVIGSEVSGVGTAPMTDFTFPGGATAAATGGAAYGHWYNVNLNSCLVPALQIH